MSNNIKFWLIATLSFVITGSLGFIIGGWAVANVALDFLNVKPHEKESLGMLAMTIAMVGVIGAFVGVVFGIILSLIFIRRLGKRWGSQLNFGRHPVLKLTILSFISFLIIGFILLSLYANT